MLGKDRLYERACGFVTDQQIWLLGVLRKYFMNQVMHFEHEDFLTALACDMGPFLGATGMWVLEQYAQKMKEDGKADKLKKARAAIDLLNEFLENGLTKLGKSSLYNMKNKYCPKKMPTEKKVREQIPHLYSWTHYAPQQWFAHIRKSEDKMKNVKVGGEAANASNLCSYCQSPEGEVVKHKRCSQCKTRLYCSTDCQKYDWKKGHSKECKALMEKAKAKAK